MAQDRVVIPVVFDAETGQASIAAKDLDKLGKGADGARGKVGGLKGALAKMVGPLLAVAGAAAALRGAFRLLSESVKLAGIQQIADRKLEQAIRNTGAATEEWLPRLKAAAAELQRTSNYGDEMTQTAQAMLLSFKEVGGPAGAELLTSRLGDMAAGVTKTGGTLVDLNQMAALMGRAMTTGASALTRVGVSLSDAEAAAFNAATGMDKVRLLGDIIDSNFGGMAQAIADPFVQAENAVNDLKEILGAELRTSLGAVAAELTRLAQDEGVITMVRKLGGVVAGAAEVFGGFVSVLGQVTSGLEAVADRSEGAARALLTTNRDLSATERTVSGLALAVRWLYDSLNSLRFLSLALGITIRERVLRGLADLLAPLGRVSRGVERLVNGLRAAQSAARLDFRQARAELDALQGSASGAARALAKLPVGKRMDAGAPAVPAYVPPVSSGPAPAAREIERVQAAAERAKVELDALMGRGPGVEGFADIRREEIATLKAEIDALASAGIAALQDVEGAAVPIAERTMMSLAQIAETYGDSFAAIMGGLGDIFRTVGGQSRAAFAAYKALAIGEATIAGILAVQKSLPNIPLAIAMGVTAAANVARIASASMGGGGGSAETGGGYSERGGGTSSLAAGLALSPSASGARSGGPSGHGAPVVNVAPAAVPQITVEIDGAPVARAVARANGRAAVRRGTGGGL